MFRRKKSGCAAAKMQLPQYRLFAHQRYVHFPFSHNRIQVCLFNRMIGGYFFIAATIGTQRFTKWKMDIEADTIGFVVHMKLVLKNSFPVLYINALFPERNGWVTGIPGNRLVVFLE